jgi:hypothetical protein
MNQLCSCGCGKPATIKPRAAAHRFPILVWYSSACRTRFYNATLQAARRGDPDAIKLAQSRGWLNGSKKASPRKVATATVPKAQSVRRAAIPKPIVAFIASRCQSLPLAAQVLGIAPRPPLLKSVVRAAWIERISIHHPDKGGVTQAAQAVNAAYQLLSRFSQ